MLRAGYGIEFALHILGEILSKLRPVLIALDGTAINGQAFYLGEPGGEQAWWERVCGLAAVSVDDETCRFSGLPGL